MVAKAWSVSNAVTVAFCAIVAWSVAGCERSAPPASGNAITAEPILPPDLFLPTEPPGAQSVHAAKAETSAGGELVVRGRIGGRVDPFVPGSAVFLLVDKSLKMCNERHGDGCRTPWDYCCEPREDLLAASATVQVVDASGQPLKAGLRGRGGMEPGAEVVVVGQRAPEAEGGTLVINARGIYVVRR